MDRLVDERGRDYRAFCGSPGEYDLQGAAQFRLMTELGLREGHYLLDIGCGSLRAGKLFMTYLAPGHYYGLDPNFWVVEEAIKHELGKEYIEKRQPILDDEADFTLTKFNKQFDYMLSQSVFSHASLAQIDRCLSEVSKCLKPNGVYAGSMHIDGKVRYEGGWNWPTCSHHLRKDIEELTSKYHLVMKILDRQYYYHYPHDYTQTWILWSHAEYAVNCEEVQTKFLLGRGKGEDCVVRIVYSYYVLDIVHEGHLLMMRNAKALAGENGILIVGILTDEAVMEKKAKPVMSFEQRVALAQAMKYADVVVAQETYSPLPNVEKIRPDVLMESSSHSDAAIEAGRTLMRSMGGSVVVLPYCPTRSSSSIKQIIRGGDETSNRSDNL